MDSFIPAQIITNSIDAYIAKYSTKSQYIYWVVLFTVVVLLFSLPLIYVDISIQSAGTVRPMAEKTEIKSGLTEIVDSVFFKEGDPVKKGDVIISLRSLENDYKINYQQNNLNDITNHLNDLAYLAKGQQPTVFSSDTRRKEYISFLALKNEYQTNLEKAEKDYNRSKTLFEKEVIALEEFEKYEHDFRNTKIRLESFIEDQTSKWQTDLNTYTNSKNEVVSNLNLELQKKDLYQIISPVSGTLDQFRGIYKGSNIQAGSTLAVISPDSTLYIEVYVSSRDIGYIQPDMPVNIRIESFNYNEWGMINGRVTDISSDFLTDNVSGTSYYIVKCIPEKNYLSHKRGVKGYLKKGMAVSTHFMVDRRSLFDLLYQRLDDWFNPTQYTTQINS